MSQATGKRKEREAEVNVVMLRVEKTVIENWESKSLRSSYWDIIGKNYWSMHHQSNHHLLPNYAYVHR